MLWWYEVTVKADDRHHKFRTVASSETSAKEIIQKAEKCPVSAITEVKRKGKVI